MPPIAEHGAVVRALRLCQAATRALPLVLVLAAAAALLACGLEKEAVLTGRTMGTTYQVKIVTGPMGPPSDLARAIEHRLEQINQRLSTYRPDSEISRFNALHHIGRPFRISNDFRKVFDAAARLHRWSEGAWDGTVDPLVQLWGFGREKPRRSVPAPDEIRSRLGQVGFGLIRTDPSGALSKRHPEVSLDLASLAKGYGVDALAALIRQRGLNDFLVEIGGEVYAGGRRPDGGPWRVGINSPEAGAAANAVYGVVALADRALATSGDYRNFFELDGRRYAHIIDPRSGYPVRSGVISASVLADTCMLADGLATTLVVLGADRGLELVEGLPGVECLIITRDDQGRPVNHRSSGFEPAAER